MTRVYVSIGSNFDREKNICYALDNLQQTFLHLTFSSVYKSQDIRNESADFYNLVAGFNTNTDLVNLLKRFKQLEHCCGRVKKGVVCPLDLDLLLFGNIIYHQGKIQVPKTQILEHTFVLKPLAEIAGDEKHPVMGKRFKDLWDEFPNKKRHPLTLVYQRF